MSTQWIESGSTATQDLSHWPTVVNTGSTVSSDGTQTLHGNRSILCATGGAGQAAYVSNQNGPGPSVGNNGRILCRFRIAQYPTSGTNAALIAVFTGAAGFQFSLSMDNTGLLKLFNNSLPVVGSQIGSSGGTLSLNTWYRLCLTWSISSATVFTIKHFLDGVGDAAATSGTLGNTTLTFFRVGCPSGDGVPSGATGVTVNLTGVYVDDDSTTMDVGDRRVTSKLPAADNVNNWTSSIGTDPGVGFRYQNVSERPLSEVHGRLQVSPAAAQENFTLQAAAVGDADVSAKLIVARMAWVWAKTSAASAAAKLMDNGTETAIATTTSPALQVVITDSASYPSNVAGIGMRSTGSAIVNTSLYECGTLLAYDAAVAVLPSSKTELTLGPPLRGAPWVLRVRQEGSQIAAQGVAPPAVRTVEEFVGGPPLRGAPWGQLSPRAQGPPPGVGPEPTPPTPAGHNRPFLPRVTIEDLRSDGKRRLLRFTEATSTLLNALLQMGAIVQTGPATYELVEVSYNPAVSGHWQGATPSDVKAALDRIVAWIASQGGTLP